MADDRMALLETMRKAGIERDADFLRQSVQVLAEAVMEAEVTELTGVPHGVRDPEHRQTEGRDEWLTGRGEAASWGDGYLRRHSPQATQRQMDFLAGHVAASGSAGHSAIRLRGGPARWRRG